KLSVVESLLPELLSALYPDLEEDPCADPSLIGLQVKLWSMLGQMANETSGSTKVRRAVKAALMIMNHICSLLATEQFMPPTPEHVFVSAWTHILNLIFHGSKIRAIPGLLNYSAHSTNPRILKLCSIGISSESLDKEYDRIEHDASK
ncbi:hypothetical protein BGZ76_004460, partial [Entomortierella beljakovae]